MIFIFDWGHETIREIGPLSKNDLDIELPDDMYMLGIRKKWFRAFFIRTIPTATDFVLVGEESGLVIPVSEEVFNEYRPLAELNAKVMEEKISDKAYAAERAKMGF